MKKYQFLIDGRAFGYPVRSNWRDAAQDAVNSGHAVWCNNMLSIKMDDQGEIRLIEEPKEITNE